MTRLAFSTLRNKDAMVEPSRKTEYAHLPVLCQDVVAAFDFGRPALIVDGTLGLGGHSQALLERYPDLSILGLDWDAEALEIAEKRLAKYDDRIQCIPSSYAQLPEVLKAEGI